MLALTPEGFIVWEGQVSGIAMAQSLAHVVPIGDGDESEIAIGLLIGDKALASTLEDDITGREGFDAQDSANVLRVNWWALKHWFLRTPPLK